MQLLNYYKNKFNPIFHILDHLETYQIFLEIIMKKVKILVCVQNG
ncbi:hypothetical protein SBF1_4470002 [Candidatus Desulfosporosinus infrequens]|uniref:Uncharacterized protein n=1 Tax=Candidatus Desulfosporosinus infrequens TaxID=2043169 RepID=A0A2U3LBP6_9FIRM|nr:hypothetical protein SBF1_4470002 [Candidatus Desulfosporosinus infrequens]